jgi:hypothetical protein
MQAEDVGVAGFSPVPTRGCEPRSPHRPESSLTQILNTMRCENQAWTVDDVATQADKHVRRTPTRQTQTLAAFSGWHHNILSNRIQIYLNSCKMVYM